MRRSLFLLNMTLLVMVAAACEGRASPTGVPTPASPRPAASVLEGLGLTETHTFDNLGFSMAYPAGWLTRSSGNTRFVSELDEDHNKPWPLRTGPRPSKGFEVSLTTVSKRAIRRYSTRDLDAVMRIWKGFYALEVPSESNVEQMFLGEPVLRGTGNLGFGQVVNCIVGHNPELVFLLCLLAPSEQALRYPQKVCKQSGGVPSV